MVINFAIIIASNANRDDKLIFSRSAAFYVNMPTDGSNLFKVRQANATSFWPFLFCFNFPEFFPRGTSWRFINGTSNHVTNFVLVWNQYYSFGSRSCWRGCWGSQCTFLLSLNWLRSLKDSCYTNFYFRQFSNWHFAITYKSIWSKQFHKNSYVDLRRQLRIIRVWKEVITYPRNFIITKISANKGKLVFHKKL